MQDQRKVALIFVSALVAFVAATQLVAVESRSVNRSGETESEQVGPAPQPQPFEQAGFGIRRMFKDMLNVNVP